MPLLNFKKEFAPMVELGLKDPEHPDAKRQTIRARRKDLRDPQAGQTLYLYTGLRTTVTRKLGEPECKSSEPISIDEHYRVVLGVTDLSTKEISNVAAKDGFGSISDFFEFFRKTHGFPFYGFLIKW